jgi:hypothetical protein
MQTNPQHFPNPQQESIPKVNPLMIDQYICSICLCLMNYPKTLVCSHSFCGSCLSQSYLEHQTCPLCRGQISENPSQIPVNPELFQEIKKYSKSCCNNIYSMASLHTGDAEEVNTRVGCFRSQMNNLIFPSEDNLDRTVVQNQSSNGVNRAVANQEVQSFKCLLRYSKRSLVISSVFSFFIFAAFVVFI